jgi:hypothetical protein
MHHIFRLATFTITFVIVVGCVLPPIPNIEPITDEVSTSNSCYLDTDQPQLSDTKPSLTILIRRLDPDFETTDETITIDPASKPTSTDIALDLSETIEHQLVLLEETPDRGTQFRIEQQFENSMALGAEGPHYDLVNWKHYTSSWQAIENSAPNRFVTRRLAEADYGRFPKVTTNEIVNFLRKDGASPNWIRLAQSCKNADSGSCYVTTSRISLRISSKVDGRWNLLHTVNFMMPMGC